MAFEDEFGLKIEDDQIEGISTVDDIVHSISKAFGNSEED